jgi:hypothetical protein
MPVLDAEMPSEESGPRIFNRIRNGAGPLHFHANHGLRILEPAGFCEK